jgi:chemotaxis protein MotB
MSADDECECIQEECVPGAPAWVMTFADLMSLLMCFFVLLLSFSEMDVMKFKQMAGSMREAFGVQRQVKLEDIPMGTSVIAQEFSPGKADPTPVDDVRQKTSQEEVNLETAKEVMEQAAEAQAEELRLKMQQEIEAGLIEVDSQQDKVIIRIKEKGSFSSGTAELDEEFMPILERIRLQIATTPATITVAGHTDDVPIKTFRFRSNWELSSSRAVSVLEQLLKGGGIRPDNTEVKGLADTQPLVPNDSREHRATNRRVEIILAPDTTIRTNEPVGKSVTPDSGSPLKSVAKSSIIPPLPEPIVIQDDNEAPALQPELSQEIEDLFGNLNNQ